MLHLRQSLAFVVLASLFLTGCGKKSATSSGEEPTKAQRSEAAMLISEAEFAVQLRDHARAEPLLAKAVTLVGDNPDHWVMLGSTRLRLGNIDGARQAYREALAVVEREYKKNPDNPGLVLEQVHAHALLGQVDKARAVLEKGGKAHPTSQELQNFIKANALDQLMKEPAFKQMALPQ